MKLTKTRLKKLIKEELESFTESEGGPKVYLVMKQEYDGQTVMSSWPKEAYLREEAADLRALELNANEKDEDYGYEVVDYPLRD